MADTLPQLINKIEIAFDSKADVVIDPATARRLIAEEIATAVNAFIVTRKTVGTISGSTVTTFVQ